MLLGFITGYKAIGILMRLEDGVAHAVDSSELAFRLAARGAMRASFEKVTLLVVSSSICWVLQGNPVLMEPIMTVEVVAPQEFEVNNSW